MTLTSHNSRWLLFALPLVGAVAGCCCEAFPLPGEAGCPTDARRIYCGPGEEAVRRCPCGPDSEYYGLKPTDWRPWPEGWRCGQYPCGQSVVTETVSSEPSPAQAPAPDGEVVNPFRNRSMEELPAMAVPPSKAPNKSPAPETGFGEETQPTGSSHASELLPTEPNFGSEPAPLQLPAIDIAPAPPASDSQIPPTMPPVATPPAKTETPPVTPDEPKEKESTSEDGALPKLIAAQNGAPVADETATASPSQSTPSPAPATLTALPLSWGSRPKVQPASSAEVQPASTTQVPPPVPISTRVSQHLTHALSQ